MDDALEVGAYAGAQALAHLSRLDDSFVRSALRGAPRRGFAVDVGTGAGAIPIKIARRRPELRIAAVDLSPGMLAAARASAEEVGVRIEFRRADARRLPWPSRSVDLLISNSLLHHLADPTPVLDEMARVLRPGGRLFLRDLKRPRRDRIESHIRAHGRFYRGPMRRLFADSVRAAYTLSEIRGAVARSGLRRARVRDQPPLYFVIEAGARRRAAGQGRLARTR